MGPLSRRLQSAKYLATMKVLLLSGLLLSIVGALPQEIPPLAISQDYIAVENDTPENNDVLEPQYQERQTAWSKPCAIIYQHKDFEGSSIEVGETAELNLKWDDLKSDSSMIVITEVKKLKSWNDIVSSAKVHKGCTLKLFKDLGKKELLYTLEKDANISGRDNDKVSSLSCTCVKAILQ